MHHSLAQLTTRAALAAALVILASACGTKPATPAASPSTPFATAPSVGTPAAGGGGSPGTGGPAAPATPLAGATAATAPTAAPAPAPAAGPQVVEPQVARRELKLPRYPSRDIEIGLFTGTYATQSFGSSSVSGVRLGYHITEDFFVTAQAAQTEVNDDLFQQLFPGVLFVENRTLKYYTLSMGYNLLPGEVFLGRTNAKLSQAYVLAGAGTTSFANQRKQTFDLGFGLRLLWNQRLALQAEVREHVFSLDLLGRRETTRNPEITLGASIIF